MTDRLHKISATLLRGTALAAVDVLTNPALATAFGTLRLGKTAAARRVAHGIASRGRASGDTHLQGQALLVLAHAYVFDSRFRLAYRCCSRAHDCLVRHSDGRALAEAAGVLSYVLSALGLDEHAVQAAAECISIPQSAPAPLAQAFGLNYAGVASLWARDFATASGVLDASAWYASQAPGGAAGFHPLVNAGLCEALRIVQAEADADLSKMERIVARVRAMERRGRVGILPLGSRDIGLLLLAFEECFLACRLGDLEEADVCYQTCRNLATHLPPTSWLYAVTWWARVEWAQAHRRHAEARSSAAQMAMSARLGEHTPLRALGLAIEHALRSADTRDQP